MELDDYILTRLERVEPEFAWKDGSPQQLGAWQNRSRKRVAALIGGLSNPSYALQPKVLETKRFDDYQRELVTFQSRPGLRASGYVLSPLPRPTSELPCIVCLPGHGRGAESIVGIAEDGSQRSIDRPDEYQADFALQCVRHGYIAFALEQFSFGVRRTKLTKDTPRSTSSCKSDSMAALMLGETMTGWRVWDTMRAIDYLVTRPEVDGRKMGVIGISGGGLTALWTACQDTRIRAAVVSGYFCTFRDSILSIDHCVDNYVPGMLKLMEMPDMAGLVAPRALFVESGTHDQWFPQSGFEYAVKRAAKIYSSFRAADQFGWELFDGDHHFYGVGAFEFLDRVMPACARASGAPVR